MSKANSPFHMQRCWRTSNALTGWRTYTLEDLSNANAFSVHAVIRDSSATMCHHWDYQRIEDGSYTPEVWEYRGANKPRARQLWSSPLNISVKVKDSRLDLSDRRTQVMRSSSQLYYYPSADHKLAARPMSHGEMAPNIMHTRPSPFTYLHIPSSKKRSRTMLNPLSI